MTAVPSTSVLHHFHRHTGGLLQAYMLVLAVCTGVYWAAGADPSAWQQLIASLVFWWLVTNWIIADARLRGLPLAFDQGLFVYVAWPIYIPVHLVRTRGALGLLWIPFVVLLFYAVMFTTAFLTLFALNGFGPTLTAIPSPPT
jgi:hypothetical protein